MDRSEKRKQYLQRLTIALFFVLTGQWSLAGSNCPAVNLLDDSPIDFNRYKGKTVYIDFWASWCGPCRASFPFMNELQQSIGRDKLEIIAISVDDDKNDALSFLDKTPAEFTVAIDSTGQCPKHYGVTAMPSSFIINSEGNVVYQHRGFNKSAANTIKEKITNIVQGAE